MLDRRHVRINGDTEYVSAFGVGFYFPPRRAWIGGRLQQWRAAVIGSLANFRPNSCKQRAQAGIYCNFGMVFLSL